MIRVVHPTGNTFVRALLCGLVEEKLDFEFWTTIGMQQSPFLRCLPSGVRDQLRRRVFDVPCQSMRTSPWREWVRLLAPALSLRALTQHETGWASVDAVYQSLDAKVARNLRASRGKSDQEDWIYGYEDGAASSFAAAAELGMRRAYELPIAYWKVSRRLLDEEAGRWPAWAPTLAGPADSEAKLQRKEQELNLADVVIVPSTFVRNSLPQGIEKDKRVVTAPFGTPSFVPKKNEAGRFPMRGDRRLRLLFAGSLSQRKGLADLFGALKLLKRTDVELVVMGSLMAPMSFYRSHGVSFVYEPPRPHVQVLELMETCDVLVLPSIVEGRALVQQEAMACGLPVIATTNAGCEDLVIDGETGFLIPIRSPESLASRIDWMAAHRDEVCEMGRAAKVRASRVTWETYKDGIFNHLGLRKETAFIMQPHFSDE